MFSVFSSKERYQSLGEEIANSVSHGVGALAILATAPLLMLSVIRNGNAFEIAGTIIFVVTAAILFLASTLYHAFPRNKSEKTKQVFKIIDHSAIFLLIAGTYTPFTLGVLRGPWGWSLFGVVWIMGIAGIVMTAFCGTRYRKLKTCLYLLLGWMVLVAIRPMLQLIPSWGLFWLVAGGLAYTIGVAFYAAKHIRYSHFVWHLFVMTGTACHFVAVWFYAAK